MFAVNGHIIEEKKGEPAPMPGRVCMSTADCPRGEICLFPVPHHGEPGIIEEKKGEPAPMPGRVCMSTADCPRGEICLFPVPHHGEPGVCS
uniref:Uncharacterized protein n=1 Tax=Panagrolaimus sp. PS1159 TaxID=55785 RepID=A0AC35FDI2_9BILA